MTIKNDILNGIKRSRRETHTLTQLDGYALAGEGSPPWRHSVRARVSEMTKARLLVRNTNGTYSLGDTE